MKRRAFNTPAKVLKVQKLLLLAYLQNKENAWDIDPYGYCNNCDPDYCLIAKHAVDKNPRDHPCTQFILNYKEGDPI